MTNKKDPNSMDIAPVGKGSGNGVDQHEGAEDMVQCRRTSWRCSRSARRVGRRLAGRRMGRSAGGRSGRRHQCDRKKETQVQKEEKESSRGSATSAEDGATAPGSAPRKEKEKGTDCRNRTTRKEDTVEERKEKEEKGKEG